MSNKFSKKKIPFEQRWMNGIQEHINYSTHYLWGIEKSSDADDYGKKIDFHISLSDEEQKILSANVAKPLGSMAENLARAKANFDVLEVQLNDASVLVQSLEKNVGFRDGKNSNVSVPMATVMVGTVLNSYLVNFILFLKFFFSNLSQ